MDYVLAPSINGPLVHLSYSMDWEDKVSNKDIYYNIISTACLRGSGNDF